MLSRGQRCALAGGTAFAHLVAISLLVTSGRLAVTPQRALPIEVSFWELRPQVRSRPSAPKPLVNKVPVQGVGAVRTDEPVGFPAASPTQGQTSIDWGSEAGAAADDIVRGLVKGQTRHCDDSPKREPWMPPCRRHPGRFEWSAEPKRAGFESGLPYVRLGKYCVLSVGVFGCALGSPEANGHLFDDMKDPDRDRSSVPDISEINEPADEATQRRSVLVKP